MGYQGVRPADAGISPLQTDPHGYVRCELVEMYPAYFACHLWQRRSLGGFSRSQVFAARVEGMDVVADGCVHRGRVRPVDRVAGTCDFHYGSV